jgi:hypothetical protein
MMIYMRHVCSRRLVLILRVELLIVVVLASLVIYIDWNICEHSLLNLMQSP